MGHHYSPVHHGTLTNHLPMYQKAMKTLGINHQTILARSASYIEARALKDLDGEGVTVTRFEERYLTLVAVYRKALADKPQDEVLRHFMANKKTSMASGLFHGMIRLSFAVEVGDREELARALAYFDVIAEPMVIPSGGRVAEVPKEAWNKLMAQRSVMAINFTPSATMDKVSQILEIKPLMALVTDIDVVDDTAKRMAFIFANWYMRTRDFYVLHVITGYQGLLRLKPYLEDFDGWLKTYWQLAQIFSLFTEERLPIIKISVSPWEAVMEEAMAMTDVHDVKLFYAAKDLYDRYGLQVFNKVAHIVSHKYWGISHH